MAYGLDHFWLCFTFFDVYNFILILVDYILAAPECIRYFLDLEKR